MALAALSVAIVAALIALASAAYTRRQAVAAEATAAIETKRMHDDLTPQLVVTCTERPETNQADMTVELTGPAGLDGLDEVTIRIRDDYPHHGTQPGMLTQQQVAETIWGLYRLNPLVPDTDPDGRAHGPFRLPKHQPYLVHLERTTAPSWTTPEYWHRYDGKPVRLEITCRRAGFEPWILGIETEIESEPGAYIF
jgi:hypothetical protein